MKTIIVNIGQLATPIGSRLLKGAEMERIKTIEKNGFLVMEEGRISVVGDDFDRHSFKEDDFSAVIDAGGGAVIPGFVDSHSHLIFGGYRNDEFFKRINGVCYTDIAAAGGGILSSVKTTRAATMSALVDNGIRLLAEMAGFGVTTVETKSGYGLERESEIKQLEAIAVLQNSQPLDIVATFLGPHSIPPDMRADPDAFIDRMVALLPEIKERRLAEFADIFCEQNVFSVDQSRRFLRAAKEAGFSLKIHADEIAHLGGAELAAELGAISADHLLKTGDVGIEQMAAAGVVATLLPATAFCLKEPYANARKLIDAGCGVALASDCNPGSCFSNSLPLVIALAAIYMNMSIAEILTALTLNGAAAVGRAEQIGTLEVGKQADIVILSYPCIDFLAYHSGVNIISKVIKNGRLIIDNC